MRIIVSGIRAKDCNVLSAPRADALLAGSVAANLIPAPHAFVVRDGAGKCSSLTRRETEVMQGLSEGLLYREIADRLGISYSAVHKHQHKIYVKFAVTNRTEALRVWLARGGI